MDRPTHLKLWETVPSVPSKSPPVHVDQMTLNIMNIRWVEKRKNSFFHQCNKSVRSTYKFNLWALWSVPQILSLIFAVFKSGIILIINVLFSTWWSIFRRWPTWWQCCTVTSGATRNLSWGCSTFWVKAYPSLRFLCPPFSSLLLH